MKPAAVLGFGLLLLLFLPGLSASDEPEPFFQFQVTQTFPDPVHPGQSTESDLPKNLFDQQTSVLTAGIPEWERQLLSLWIG